MTGQLVPWGLDPAVYLRNYSTVRRIGKTQSRGREKALEQNGVSMGKLTKVVEQDGRWTACICTSPDGHVFEFRKRDGSTEVTMMRGLVSELAPQYLPLCEKM